MQYQEIAWSLQAGYPLLAVLQLFPLVMAVLVAGLRNTPVAFGIGLAGAVTELALAVDLFRRFERSEAALQFVEHVPLVGPLSYHAAADGVTVLLILLTSLLTLFAVLYGQIRQLGPAARFLAVVFLVEAVLVGLFATVDLLWFLLLCAVQIGLLGYLLWAWATSAERDLALARYLQFMSTGLVLVLAGAVVLAWHFADTSGGSWSFDLTVLAGNPVPPEIATIVFFLMFYGFAIWIPVFPLHGWLPVVAEHGTVAVATVFLLGLKIGIYGLLRFVLPLLPEAVLYWQPYVVTFAVAGVFYAALLALMQVNLRRLLAYAVVSHTGVVVVGLLSLSLSALQGGVILAVNFGLAGAVLMLMSGLIFQRTHTLLLSKLGGLFDRLPLVGVTFFIAGLSIIGMPGTPGFDAVHLVLEGAIARFGALLTIAAALGNVVAAGFLLWSFQRAFLTPRPAGAGAPEIARAGPLETLLAALGILVLLGSGFYSQPWLELIETSLQGLAGLYAP